MQAPMKYGANKISPAWEIEGFNMGGPIGNCRHPWNRK